LTETKAAQDRMISNFGIAVVGRVGLSQRHPPSALPAGRPRWGFAFRSIAPT